MQYSSILVRNSGLKELGTGRVVRDERYRRRYSVPSKVICLFLAVRVNSFFLFASPLETTAEAGEVHGVHRVESAIFMLLNYVLRRGPIRPDAIEMLPAWNLHSPRVFSDETTNAISLSHINNIHSTACGFHEVCIGEDIVCDQPVPCQLVPIIFQLVTLPTFCKSRKD
jgi:hypothetical protein